MSPSSERRSASGDPRLSVVVLTYQSGASLERCLASLQPQVDALGGELLVIDNDSADDTVEVARRAGIEAVPTGGNLGFAAGCNVGARHASGDLLVFVNPDSVVDDGCLAALVDAADEDGRWGPLGGRAHHPDGSYDRRSVLGRPSLRGAIAFASAIDMVFRGSAVLDPEHGPTELPASGPPVPVPAVSGALLAMPRPLWDRLGGFDECYFLYGEDVDLSLRATALGWQPVVVPEAGYVHVGGVSTSSISLRDILLYRGKVELYRRHLSPLAARIAIIALQVGTALRGAGVYIPVERIAARGRPWWELFRARRAWRQGYRDRQRPSART